MVDDIDKLNPAFHRVIGEEGTDFHGFVVIDEFVSVTDDEAFAAGIRIARTDGVLVGPTTGAVLHAASEWGKENAGTAVVISADSAAKYLSAYADYL